MRRLPLLFFKASCHLLSDGIKRGGAIFLEKNIYLKFGRAPRPIHPPPASGLISPCDQDMAMEFFPNENPIGSRSNRYRY